ncbi:MAG: hypothetical protein JXB47_18080 [Anaerolineae bacterium]|nr:hypothetical protein [Anaerolineae bacterium]
MRPGIEAIRWAPRVPMNKIRRLYELDAQGIVDEDLIDDVAYALYARCESILTVTDAVFGRVKCPCCGAMVARRPGDDKTEVLTCAACGWQVTWGEYFQTYHRKQLAGGGAVGFFKEYRARLPGARSPQAKMLLIDWMIHRCHLAVVQPGTDPVDGRPAAVNLIQGNMTQVMFLLDELAYGPGSTPGVVETRDAWRAQVMGPYGGLAGAREQAAQTAARRAQKRQAIKEAKDERKRQKSPTA